MKPSGQHEAPFGSSSGDAVHASEYTADQKAVGTKRSKNNSVNTHQVRTHGAAGGAGLKGGPDINDGYNDKGNPHKMKPGF